MTPENQQKYDEKLQRIQDAVALKEPDRVPICPISELYHILHAGYTIAEVIYDTTLTKARHAAIKYLTDFDPDRGIGVGLVFAGEGPVMEMQRSKTMRWAGMPGAVIDKNSLQQFIEFPLLEDDEFDEFFADRTGWSITKAMPRGAALFDPLADFSVSTRSARQLAALFSRPDYKAMIQTLWQINDFYQVYQARVAEIDKEIYEMGYPIVQGGGAGVPFDFYSDFLRGTILSMEDLYDRPETIERFIEEQLEATLAMIASTKGVNEGKHVFMALHKGMDGFLNPEHYRKYYWDHLQKIILAIIDSGKIPYIYTEGKYNTRLDCLTEVPPGKVFYHFEDVDMAVAKKKFDGIACISGGFPAALLDWGTPAQVKEEMKRLFDVCAPGGGFIFETSCGMGHCKRENVEAMFEAAREYGKY